MAIVARRPPESYVYPTVPSAVVSVASLFRPSYVTEIRMVAPTSRARISWHMATKLGFDDHNTEALHSAFDTGAPDGPNFAAVPRNSPLVVPETPGIRPRIPECS